MDNQRLFADPGALCFNEKINMPSLFDPIQIGDLQLANRIVMAPLTRSRSKGLLPGDMAVEYYRQRASAGLIISEGTQISQQGQGYLDTPGIHRPDQIKAWKRVTDAVHAEGGKIAVQLWHVGRISHTQFQVDGQAPVSSTNKAAKGMTFAAEGFVQASTPRALRTDEMPGLVADFAHAASCAMEAGFDGVEVHGANGYLIEQFLRDSINDRQDEYGGSVENRVRFAVEVMAAIAAAIGPGRAGIRLSPVTPVNDAPQDSDAQTLYTHLAAQLSLLKLAFVHVVEGQTRGARDIAPFDYEAMHKAFTGNWMVNNGYNREMALQAVASGHADLIAFGRPFISNPDLVRRLRLNAPLQPTREASTFYGGGAHGYIDYPTLAD